MIADSFFDFSIHTVISKLRWSLCKFVSGYDWLFGEYFLDWNIDICLEGAKMDIVFIARANDGLVLVETWESASMTQGSQ